MSNKHTPSHAKHSQRCQTNCFPLVFEFSKPYAIPCARQSVDAWERAKRGPGKARTIMGSQSTSFDGLMVSGTGRATIAPFLRLFRGSLLGR